MGHIILTSGDDVTLLGENKSTTYKNKETPLDAIN
jgi:hypothetical protein